MRLHRPGGDVQARAGLLVGVAGADQAQHLPFTSGELIQFRVQRHGRVAAEGVKDEPREAGGEVGVVGVDPRDRLAQLRASDRLGDVAAGAAADDADHVGGVVRDR